MYFGTCPQCQQKLNNDKIFGMISICECGWSGSQNQQIIEKSRERKTIVYMISSAFLIAGLFGTLVYTGTMNGLIQSIKIKKSLHIASTSELEELAQACRTINDSTCVTETYRYLTLTDSDKPRWLLQLAKAKFHMENYEESAQAFSLYFSEGGEAVMAHYYYAKSLEKSGAIHQAIARYKKVMESESDHINLNATKGLVQLLIKEGRYKEARSIITRFKKSTNSNVNNHFSQELQMLKQVKS